MGRGGSYHGLFRENPFHEINPHPQSTATFAFAVPKISQAHNGLLW